MDPLQVLFWDFVEGVSKGNQDEYNSESEYRLYLLFEGSETWSSYIGSFEFVYGILQVNLDDYTVNRPELVGSLLYEIAENDGDEIVLVSSISMPSNLTWKIGNPVGLIGKVQLKKLTVRDLSFIHIDNPPAPDLVRKDLIEYDE